MNIRISETSVFKKRYTSADVASKSLELMMKAGMIHMVSAGIYAFLPYGLTCLQEIKKLVRQVMVEAGYAETLLPNILPVSLLLKSRRLGAFGKELLTLQDRHQNDLYFGPTHEEPYIEIVKEFVQGYRQLPIHLFQVQTKFRDELRPRSGLLRGREFAMKDAYSFHTTRDCLEVTYERTKKAYEKFFFLLNLPVVVVEAAGGSIGGDKTHEFHLLSDVGEDKIICNQSRSYVANIETANYLLPTAREASHESKRASSSLEDRGKKLLKVEVYESQSGNKQAFVLCKDHMLNQVKMSKVIDGATLAKDQNWINLPMVVDHSAYVKSDFSLQLNNAEYWHGLNWGQDFDNYVIADIRNAQHGDISPDGIGHLEEKRGIELGHIFQLQDTYSEPMDFKFADAQGQKHHVLMGCYGIGLSRVLAAMIEHYNDDKGITFPQSFAPYKAAIIPISNDNLAVKSYCEQLFSVLKNVALDDRDVSVEEMFEDANMKGYPYQIVVNNNDLSAGVIQVINRRDGSIQTFKASDFAGIQKFLET